MLFLSAAAHADYEQVANFAQGLGEAGPLTNAQGMAVNSTGAGGVEAGSLYVVGANNRVLRYGPGAEGEAPPLREEWGWEAARGPGGGSPSRRFGRCGPALGSECTPLNSNYPPSEERLTACGAATDSAGDLYVLDRRGVGRVYGPGGSLLTEFSFSEGPLEDVCDLAVDAGGAVYAVLNQGGSSLHRDEVRKLKPQGGEYPPTSATKYAASGFAGGARSFVFAENGGVGSLAIDPSSQRLYLTEAAGNEVQEFIKPAEPFKLRCEGRETATLPATASFAEIKAALEAAPVQCGTVDVFSLMGRFVAGELISSWAVVFEGALAETHVASLEVIKAGGDEEAYEMFRGSPVSHISAYETDGTRVGGIIDPGVAGADYYGIGAYGANGDVYVADKAHSKVYVLGSGGALKTEIDGAGCEKGAFGAMERPALAVDQSDGNVLVSDVKAHGVVDELDSSGNCLLSVDRPFAEAGPSAIAIDNSGGPSDRVAYVTSQNGTLSTVYAYAPPSGAARAALPALSHEETGPFANPWAVAVDQATGYVYVLNIANLEKRRHDLVEVFSADGSKLIAHFADAGDASETFDESPAKVHNSRGGIAVDEAGTVYLGDAVFGNPSHSRVMCFAPESPGDYESYAYCGRAADIETGSFEENFKQISLDDSGHLYGVSEGWLKELSPASPETPLCAFHERKNGLRSMTADPATGEVFAFNYKDEKVHRFAPCDPEKGTFEEAQEAVKPAPETTEMNALAFDPALHWGPARPRGVLYGADAGFHKEYEPTISGSGAVFAPAAGPARTLTVSKSGSGQGTVTSDPEGIDCGSECEADFPEGETLALTAEAAEGSTFSGWSGECASVSGNECEVTMSAARSVTASFEEEGGGTPEYPLTTNVEGEGSIECTPPGGGCEAEYPQGTTVTLTATPDEGWEFEEWTGACAGTLLPVCEATIEEATEVGAVFAQVLHTLTVSVSGEGEVSADSGAISGCTSAGGSECEGEYPEGSTVTLTETPAEGSHFTGWGTPQCDESTEPTCEVTIGSGDEAVAASFASNSASGPRLTLNIEEGEGTVVSDPAGIDCTGEAGDSCSTETIDEGTVTLTASPAPGYLFKSWRKCDSGGVAGRQCTISLTEAKEVGAKFVKAWSLEGSKSGGPGILNTSPGGVNCGYACTESSALYKEGSLTVKQKPAKHFHFVEFANGTGSAAVCNGEQTCSFTIAEDSSIEEVYAEDAKNTLSVAKVGGGQGFVKTKPTNVNCGYTCGSAQAQFYASEEPEVTVTLGKGTSQVTWESGAGTCTGHALSCKVPMSSAHELVAKFE